MFVHFRKPRGNLASMRLPANRPNKSSLLNKSASYANSSARQNLQQKNGFSKLIGCRIRKFRFRA
jgi:hypothetical protein